MATHISGGGGAGNMLVGNSLLKEQAQKRRELEAKQPWSKPQIARPLFGPPIQVNRSNDPTHAKLSNLFGCYDEAKELVGSKEIYGVLLQPPTPQTPSAPSFNGDRTNSGVSSKLNGLTSLEVGSQPSRNSAFEQFKRQQQALETKKSDSITTKVCAALTVTSDGVKSTTETSSSGEPSSRVHGLIVDTRNKTSGSRSSVTSMPGHDRPNHLLQNSRSDVASRTESNRRTVDGSCHQSHQSHQSEKDRSALCLNATSSNRNAIAYDKLATTPPKLSSSLELSSHGVKKSGASAKVEKSTVSTVLKTTPSSASGATDASEAHSSKVRALTSKPSVNGMSTSSSKVDAPAFGNLDNPGKLRLTIPSPKDHGQFEDFVSGILQEVSVPSPLTAIRSPKKDDSMSCFPFQIPPTCKESREKIQPQLSQDRRASSTDTDGSSLQSSQCYIIVGGSQASTHPQQQQPLPQQRRRHHQQQQRSSSSDVLPLDQTPQKHLPSDLMLSSDEDEIADDDDRIENGPIPDGHRKAAVIVSGANTVESRARRRTESSRCASQPGNRTGTVDGVKAEAGLGAQHLPHLHHSVPDRQVTPSRTLQSGNVSSSSSQPHVTSSTTKSVVTEAAANSRPKKVETSTSNHRVVKKQTSADTVTANGNSSSESEEESSDESEEESESNSSDEEEHSAIDKNAKPKGFVPDVKDVTSAVADMDVDKQNTPWCLSNFIRPGHPQVPSCMTAPNPVAVPSVKITRASMPSDLSQGLSADENELENLCPGLLFDDHGILSPLPIDRSSVLDSMSHDMDDVFDSVMYDEDDILPPLADLPSQLTFVSQSSLTFASQSSNDADSSNLPATPPVISVIPPALSFSNGRPSIVVRLRRLPSRKYRSKSPHDCSVQQAKGYVNTVQTNKVEKCVQQIDVGKQQLTEVEVDRTRKLSVSPIVKSSKSNPAGKSQKKADVKLEVKHSPIAQLNGKFKTSVQSSPHKTDVKLTVADMTCSPIRQFNLQLNTNIGLSSHKSDSKISVPSATGMPVTQINSLTKANVQRSPCKSDMQLSEANALCSPVRQLNGMSQRCAVPSPCKTDLSNAVKSLVPHLNGVIKADASPSPRRSSGVKRKLSKEPTDDHDIKTEKPSLSVSEDCNTKHIREAESPCAKQRKSEKNSLMDKKQQSGASSRTSVRWGEEKRKSDSLTVGETSANLSHDKKISVANSTMESAENQSVTMSIQQCDSVANDSELAVSSVGDSPPISKLVNPVLIPSATFFKPACANDSQQSLSDKPSLRQSLLKDEKVVPIQASVVSNDIGETLRKVVTSSTAIYLKDKLKAEDSDILLRCNGDTFDDRVVSVDTSAQKTTDLKSQDMTSVDRRPVTNGDAKPLDRRKDDRHFVKVEDEKLMPSKYYLELGQKLKHQGDATADRIDKMLIYLKSVLMFIRHGDAMEREGRSSLQMFTNRKETLRFCQSVCDIHYFSGLSADVNRSKLMVVGLRLLAFIHYKLYSIKKSEIRGLKRAVDESLQNPNFKPVQVPSPYNGHGSATPATLNDTLSPLSSHLTPSPAGSVSSVGSAGSQGNDPCVARTVITSGHSKFVTVPQHVYSSMLSYVGFIGHLQDCHDHWDKADAVIASNQVLMEFFTSIDDECGKLSVVSRMAMISLHCNKVFENLRSTVG